MTKRKRPKKSRADGGGSGEGGGEEHSGFEFCTFCGRDRKEAGRMVAGPPGIYICEECVGLCNSILDQDRVRREAEPLDLAALGALTFSPPAPRFRRAVDLGFEVIRRRGAAGAVFSGANEAAVQAFLDGRIRFGRIVELVEETLTRAPAVDEVTLEALLDADAWARAQVNDAVA